MTAMSWCQIAGNKVSVADMMMAQIFFTYAGIMPEMIKAKGEKYPKCMGAMKPLMESPIKAYCDARNAKMAKMAAAEAATK